MFGIFVASCAFFGLSSAEVGAKDDGNSGEDTNGDTGGDSDEDPGGGGTIEKLAGYQLDLVEGSYWEFLWCNENSSGWMSSFDGGSSSSDAKGYLTLTLVAPTSIAGYQMFALELSGDIPARMDESFWKFLGVSEGNLLGS